MSIEAEDEAIYNNMMGHGIPTAKILVKEGLVEPNDMCWHADIGWVPVGAAEIGDRVNKYYGVIRDGSKA